MATYSNLNDGTLVQVDYQSDFPWFTVLPSNFATLAVLSPSEKFFQIHNLDGTYTVLKNDGLDVNHITSIERTASGIPIEEMTFLQPVLWQDIQTLPVSGLSQFLLGSNDVFFGNVGEDLLGGNIATEVIFTVGKDGTLTSVETTTVFTALSGADIMYGGGGDDIYLVDNPGDIANEDKGEGIDEVLSVAFNTVLSSNVENLTLISLPSGVQGRNGTGNDFDNVITGNNAANVLRGLGGNDAIYGGGGDDTLDGGVGDDAIYGDSGDDTLDGGVGKDIMYGGSGNDFYSVDSGSDVVVEVDGEGVDGISSSISIAALAANVENLRLLDGATNGTGNSLNNTIGANDTGNTLSGLAGNDVLDGGAGNDTLDGGVGNDTMSGRLGNDTYIVDSVGDVVIEFGGQGIDQIRSSISIAALAANVENLTLEGGAINGTGNSLNNTIVGNALGNTLSGLAGDDVLDGRAGNDSMYGGIGNDTYFVDSSGDFVGELAGEGIDQIFTSISIAALAANVENLTLLDGAASGVGNALGNTITGNASANFLSGLAGNDTLIGGAGADVLDGGAGSDRLEGGADNDLYIVTNTSSDRIFDLSGRNDVLRVASIADLASSQQVGQDLVLTFTSAFSQSYTLTIENHFGTGTVETMTDLSGDQVVLATGLVGGDLRGIITGTNQSETLDGRGGDDILFAGNGSDRLIGGDGDDRLTGGNGPDAFVFGPGFGHDIVTDFSNADRIEFDGRTFQDFQEVLAAAHQVDDDVVITLDDANSITLQGFTLHNLNAGDFSFV